MNYDYHTLCDQIVAAQKQGAELMMHAHGILAENKSSGRDVVTEYDRRVQELLMTLLRQAVPEAKFYCEELDERDDLDAEHLFIIDPIDGTMNFVRGFNHSCISVAYAQYGVLKVGVIYNPYVDELFTAIAGEGTKLNGRPVFVGDAPLSESVVCYGTSPYNSELAAKTFALANKVFDASLDLRRQGSAALDLCSVAAGRAGLYFELAVSLWDYAAGALLVREAGGIVKQVSGEELGLVSYRPAIVAGTKQAVEDFLQIAKR